MKSITDRKRNVLVLPFENNTNEYVDRVKQIMSGSGFSVGKFGLSRLPDLRFLKMIYFERGAIVLSWPETRAIDFSGSRPKLSLTGLIQVALLWLVCATCRFKIVYMLHDHAVHDTSGRLRTFSKQLVRAFRAMADTVVVHDPASASFFGASYLPHPLYADIDVGDDPLHMRVAESPARPQRFFVIGAIRPYKGIENLLAMWPRDRSLSIHGRASETYLSQLLAVRQERELVDAVEIHAGWLTREDLLRLLNPRNIIVMAHEAQTMLVSAVFFESVGRCAALVARSTPFVEWAAERFQTLYSFDDESSFLEALKLAECATDADRRADAELAQAMFGSVACTQSYGTLLSSLIDNRRPSTP